MFYCAIILIMAEESKKEETKKPAAKPAAKAPAKAAAKPAAPKEIMLFMRHGAGYSVGDVKFTRDHPYQLVPAEAAERLLATEQFEKASKKSVTEFYGE